MKKIISMTILASLFAVNAMAGTATGTTTATQTLRADTPSITSIAKASKNVSFGWNTSSTGYALATFHSSGTKSYGTGYDSTQIMFKDATAVAAPSSSVSSEAFSGWTAM